MVKLNTPFEFNASTKTIVDCNGFFFIDCHETDADEIIKRLNGFDELEPRLGKANSIIENQKKAIEDAKMHEGDALRKWRILEDKKHARFNNEECWIFDQDDVESNHLESLFCPVVIKPDYLLNLLNSIDKTRSQSVVAIQADAIESLLTRFDCGSMGYVIRQVVDELRNDVKVGG